MDPIVKKVTDKFKSRSEVGIKKYGTTLQDWPNTLVFGVRRLVCMVLTLHFANKQWDLAPEKKFISPCRRKLSIDKEKCCLHLQLRPMIDSSSADGCSFWLYSASQFSILRWLYHLKSLVTHS